MLDLLVLADIPAAAAQVKRLKRQNPADGGRYPPSGLWMRPPALDELGLLEALRSHLAQTNEATSGLRISVAASPEPLPSLPAAIEVAAYRIALEGVTNAIRHAQAGACRVRFTVDDDDRPPGPRLGHCGRRRRSAYRCAARRRSDVHARAGRRTGRDV
ncbi:MAG: hypothetical protein R2838_09800 [Caldilineaceae bacterium]